MKRKTTKKSHRAPKNAVQRRILESVLAQVPFDGWTQTAFQHGVKAAGVTQGEANLLFPQGVRDLLDFFGEMSDEAVQERIAEEPGFSRFRVRDKIAFAVRAKLEFLTPYREAVRRMMMWYAMPLHLPLGMKRIYRTTDLMWREAGDTATDFNFYTKRMLLAAVLKTTMLYWLDDETSGCSASWEFLDRRISEVLKIGKTISLAKEWKPEEVLDFVKKRVGRG